MQIVLICETLMEWRGGYWVENRRVDVYAYDPHIQSYFSIYEPGRFGQAYSDSGIRRIVLLSMADLSLPVSYTRVGHTGTASTGRRRSTQLGRYLVGRHSSRLGYQVYIRVRDYNPGPVQNRLKSYRYNQLSRKISTMFERLRVLWPFPMGLEGEDRYPGYGIARLRYTVHL